MIPVDVVDHGKRELSQQLSSIRPGERRVTTSVLKDWGGDWGRYFGESPGTTLSVPGDYLAKGVEVGDLAGRYSASTSSDN